MFCWLDVYRGVFGVQKTTWESVVLSVFIGLEEPILRHVRRLGKGGVHTNPFAHRIRCNSYCYVDCAATPRYLQIYYPSRISTRNGYANSTESQLSRQCCECGDMFDSSTVPQGQYCTRLTQRRQPYNADTASTQRNFLNAITIHILTLTKYNIHLPSVPSKSNHSYNSYGFRSTKNTLLYSALAISR
jgi:hypothetical protein